MKLFLTGGFLGSGKTTAIQHAVEYLHRQHIKCGVITNDQGDQQVDTAFIKSNHIPVGEVANSCFCCNYPALEKNIQALQGEKAEVIFAESVGSCADLAATIINPLISFNPGVYNIVLSVFADVRLLVMYLQNNQQLFFEDVTYIYQKQLEEADIIIVNKIDLVTTEQLAAAKKLIDSAWPGKKILYQNSLSAGNVQTWVNTLLAGDVNNDLRPALIIDYDKYGSGEAELSWLDELISVSSNDSNAAEITYRLINEIQRRVTGANYATGHLKFFIDAGGQQQKISFTAINNNIHAASINVKTGVANLLINARVQVAPDILKQLVDGAIETVKQQFGCIVTTHKTACFAPGYPKPTHRVLA